MKKQFENLKIRIANQSDNNQIIDLIKKYPTSSSSLSYVVDRSPNYFKLSEFQGYDYRTLVAEANKILGTLFISFDKVYLENIPQNIAYTGDLRVEPFIRRTGIADNLMQEGVRIIKNTLGENPNIFTCVLKDNIAGLKKNQNLARDGFANMQKVAELRSYFMFPFYLKNIKNKNYNVRFATENDIENMFNLWQLINSKKNLARFFDLNSFNNWINNTDGLGINNNILAEKNNEIVGFMGLWNQNKTRRIIIHSQNSQIKFIRKFWNIGSKLIGIPQFPKSGQELNFYNITNLCIKENQCFEQLIYNAFKHVRRNNSMFLALCLDVKDELNKELKYFLSSTTELYLLSNYQFKNNNNLFHLEISLG